MMAELRPLALCPSDLLPKRGESMCGYGCDLVYQHFGNCARVSISGMVIEVFTCSPSHSDEDWDDDVYWTVTA